MSSMNAESVTVARTLPATPERLFAAWLSGEEHTRMTGSFAHIDASGAFVAWDGFISGQTTEQSPSSLIVQRWRSKEFDADAPDSTVTVRLSADPRGARVEIEHTDLPAGQGPRHERLWNDFYFDPMERYFTAAAILHPDLTATLPDPHEATPPPSQQAASDDAGLLPPADAAGGAPDAEVELIATFEAPKPAMAKARPAKSSSAKAGRAKPAPVKAAPAKLASAKSGRAKPAPVKAAPSKLANAKAGRAKPAPVKAASRTKSSSAKAGATKRRPAGRRAVPQGAPSKRPSDRRAPRR